jgi:hypothetical protein
VVTWPTIEMLGAGYNVHVVEDCCGATSRRRRKPPFAHGAGRRGADDDHCGRCPRNGSAIGKQRALQQPTGHPQGTGGAYGSGASNIAYTMVHKAPQSAQKPQILPKKAAH